MEVYKKVLKLFIVITVITTGFVITGAFSKVALAAEKPVELYYADYINRAYYGGGADGYICVKNLAYDKKVSVRYFAGDRWATGDKWEERPATYYKTNSDGTEVWHFNIKSTSNYTKFAIKYEVNGQTYWDNNDGHDYEVSLNPKRTEFGKNKVCFNGCNVYEDSETNERDVEIGVCGENIEGGKDIKIRYTEDNWATFKDVVTTEIKNEGYYPATNSYIKYEKTSIHLAKDVKQIKFAICYEINGIEYWDNNFGRNYTMTSSPMGSGVY